MTVKIEGTRSCERPEKVIEMALSLHFKAHHVLISILISTENSNGKTIADDSVACAVARINELVFQISGLYFEKLADLPSASRPTAVHTTQDKTDLDGHTTSQPCAEGRKEAEQLGDGMAKGARCSAKRS